MPKKYAQLKITIETLLDFQDLTIEEVTGRLKTVDDLEEESASEPVSVGGKLMLTEEQWLTWQKKKGGNDSGSTSSSKEPRHRPRGGRKQKPKGEHGYRGGGMQGEKAVVSPANARQTTTTPASTAIAPATGRRTAPAST
jgi:hypothetical protein